MWASATTGWNYNYNTDAILPGVSMLPNGNYGSTVYTTNLYSGFGSQASNSYGGAPNNSLMFAQGKGERGQTSKPDNPTKGVRAKVVGGKVVGWTIPNSQTGKRIDKPLQWGVDNGLNPNDAKWVAMGAAAGVGAMTVWEILEGLGVLSEAIP